MDKLIESVKKELKELGEQGVNAANLQMTGELVDIYKDLVEAQQMEGGSYGMTGYGRRDDYPRYDKGGRIDWYGNDYRYENDYMRRDGYGNRGNGNGYNGYNRMKEHLNRINDGVEMYEYVRERYMHGGSEERVYEGLEKLMYALCVFVESAMEFAETPQEKDIIRRHVQKMSNM